MFFSIPERQQRASQALDEPLDPAAIPIPADLLVRFAPYCRQLIRRYGTTPEQRQDLLGEIYCILHDLVQAYDTSRGVPLSAYFFTQLRACVFTRARKEWKHQSREISTSPLNEEWWEIQEVTYDSTLDQMAQREWLMAAMEQLTPRQRTVVYLRYFQARSFEDIADTLDIKPATARSLLRNGIAQLRVILRQDARSNGVPPELEGRGASELRELANPETLGRAPRRKRRVPQRRAVAAASPWTDGER